MCGNKHQYILIGNWCSDSIFFHRFFAASTMVVSYEYALEATYPIPESVSCSILNACVFFFAIVSSFGVEALLDSIDYLYSFVILGVLMLCCSLGIFVISPRLRRHEANVAATENLENVNSNCTPYNWFLKMRTTIYYINFQVSLFYKLLFNFTVSLLVCLGQIFQVHFESFVFDRFCWNFAYPIWI